MAWGAARSLFWNYLTVWVIAGAVLGSLCGLFFRATDATDEVFIDMVKTPGELFTHALKCILVPFIFCSMICSVFKLKTIVNGNKIGLATFSYYLFTTILAAVLAVLVCFAIIVPGVEKIEVSDSYLNISVVATSRIEKYQEENCRHDSGFWCKLKGTLTFVVPDNIVDAMASSQLLGVMSFGVLVGHLAEPREDGTSLIVDLATEIQTLMTKLMYILITVTPFAVFSLLCWIVMSSDLSLLAQYIGWLLAAGFTSQLLQALVVYPILYFAATRKNPWPYFVNIIPAMTTAFATSSSAATFPWTLQCATQKNNIPHTVADFVLPLGVTINMDGTCMTLVVSTFWLAYVQGLTLGFGGVILIVLTAAVSSIGTVPIPSASLMYTSTIAEAVGVELGGLFGIIVAVDWLRDRVRTVVNVTGDSFAVGIIAHRCKIEE